MDKEEMVKLRLGGETYQSIADKAGVTRQRIYQILSRYQIKRNLLFNCRNCGRLIREGTFCNEGCYYDYHHRNTLTCFYCGETFKVANWVYNGRVKNNSSGLFFCDNVCQGKWLGNNYGSGKHQRGRKWDYEKVYQLKDETGYGCTKLSRLLDIPEGTVSGILSRRNHS